MLYLVDCSCRQIRRSLGSIDQYEGLPDGFLYVPDAGGVGRHHQRIAGADLAGLAAVRGEGAAPGNEVAELLLHDLPAPTAGAALPHAGLDAIGERYYTHRQNIMHTRREGLTATYNRFHNPDDRAPDIQQLRDLHVEMDQAVAAAYGWQDLALDHGFHDTKQGVRFTVSEAARRELLDRLLALNHQRHREEVEAEQQGQKVR